MRNGSTKGSGALRIFLADDDEDDIFLFRQALSETGISYELHVASNGRKMIEVLSRLVPSRADIVFLDINMPLTNGKECLRLIRRLYSRSLPVFLLSTSRSHPDVDDARGLGATGYLSKPNSFVRFTSLLLDILQKKWEERSEKDFYIRLEVS